MNKEKNQEDIIDILKSAQEKVSGIVLPSMGLLDNEESIYVDGKEVISQKDDKEEWEC